MKIYKVSLLISTFAILVPFIAGAHGIGPTLYSTEEAEGYAIWDTFLDKQITCQELTESDFELIGEYLMGQMMGPSHENANAALEQTMGKEGEEAMHATMGKRLTGCDVNAAWPASLNQKSTNMMMGGPSVFRNFYGLPGMMSFEKYAPLQILAEGAGSVVVFLFAIWGVASFARWLKRTLKVTS